MIYTHIPDPQVFFRAALTFRYMLANYIILVYGSTGMARGAKICIKTPTVAYIRYLYAAVGVFREISHIFWIFQKFMTFCHNFTALKSRNLLAVPFEGRQVKLGFYTFYAFLKSAKF